MNERMGMSVAKKITIIVVSIVIILMVIVAFLLFWRGSPKGILSVANKFQAPSSWKLESEMVRPPAFTCLDGGTCPEVYRAWIPDKPVAKSDFSEALRKSGFNFAIEDSCTPPKNSFGDSVPLCDAGGQVDKFQVDFWLSENTDTHQQRVILDIRPLTQ